MLVLSLLAAVAFCEPNNPRAPFICAEAIHSRVPAGVMRSAAAIASGLFRDSGIQLHWNITASGARSRVDPHDPCDSADRRVLVVASRFSPRSGSATVSGKHHCAGA